MASERPPRPEVTVVGDAMLDTYHFGESTRVSPEAPIPVVRVTRTIESPGGAANVARNLVHLEAAAGLVGVCGDDDEGRRLAALLLGLGIDARLMADARPTTRKLRAVVGHHQVARLDFEAGGPVPAAVEAALVAEIGSRVPRSSAIIISDYGKGVCTARVCSATIAGAAARGIPVVADPKGRDWERYAGATVITPNLAELGEAVGERLANDDDAVARAGTAARARFGCEQLVVTRAERGMTLVTAAGADHFPTEASQVFDVTGAGDTAVAALTVALARGADITAAVRLANRAASLSVRRVGTATVSLAELAPAAGAAGKLLTESELYERAAAARSSGRRVVFTNGCFDLLHRGHIALLERARELGDLLVVAVNGDTSVRALKGDHRPVNPLADRLAVLAALRCVDCLVAFDDETPRRLLEALRPDVLVKGGDYAIAEVVGREFAGATVVLPFEAGCSTTALLGRLGAKP
jgi:D-beta-D-heptose 7-phosphate kinase / D-beta-D-heptose 1-phosphate adenosyltransferase